MASQQNQIPPEQLLELLLTLKKTTPTAARQILNAQPAIAYALISLMVSMNAINIEVFQKTLAEFGSRQGAAAAATPAPAPVPTPVQVQAPIPAIPPHMQQGGYRTSTPPAAAAAYGYPNGAQAYPGYQQQQQQYYQQQQPAAPTPPPGQYPGYPQQQYAAPQQQPAQSSTPLPDMLAAIPDEQKALVIQVLSMTPEQINMLPPQERATYIQIRATLGVPTG